MPVTIKFDSNATSPQAFVIQNATPRNDGVMTKEQAALLAGVGNEVVVKPTDPVRVEIFVRDNGSDTTGNGSLAKPYKTIQHALNTIPLIQIGPRYVINCDGHTETDPNIVFPPFLNASPIFDMSLNARHPAFASEGYVTIQALPTTLLTLNPATTTYSTDPITQLLIIQDSSAAWAPDQWKGKIVAGAGFFEFARVTGNDATHLFTTSFLTNFTAPVEIQTPSCILNNTVAFSTTVNLTSVRAKIFFQGISMIGNRAVEGDSFDYIETDICDLSGPSFGSGNSYTDLGSYIQGEGGGTITDAVYEVQSMTWLFTFIEGLTPFVQCPFWSIISTSILSCRLLDGCSGNLLLAEAGMNRGSGLCVFAGMNVTLFDVEIDNAQPTDINPNGSAICIQDGGNLYFEGGNLGGSGSAGYGVECVQQGCGALQNGEVVTFTITGTLGDLKVGANPVRTWVDFNTNPPVLSETDAVNHLARVGVNF